MSDKFVKVINRYVDSGKMVLKDHPNQNSEYFQNVKSIFIKMYDKLYYFGYYDPMGNTHHLVGSNVETGEWDDCNILTSDYALSKSISNYIRLIHMGQIEAFENL